MPVALITGISGQDGAYLAKFLLDKGYAVVGTYRRSSTLNLWRLDELGIREHPRLKLVVNDVTDAAGCIRLIAEHEPSEVYNLGAQSFVATSFEQPETTTDITGLGALHLLEAIRIVNRSIRYYQASSAEMFGLVQATPQSETTPFYPRSPYAVAKLYAHWMTINYRESYGIFASCGILFNHESPLRGLDFVTRKITDGVARIALGDPNPIRLGNLHAMRDWGYAPEYVAGMWSMLQAQQADTFVFATNETNSVRSFVDWAFQAADIEVEWRGTGETETGLCRDTGRVLVEVSPEFYRPAEVEALIGDPSKAAAVIGWRPETTVRELCAKMVAADLGRHQRRRSAAEAWVPLQTRPAGDFFRSSARQGSGLLDMASETAVV
ncbi:MAG: GDP-mannose 4,6-dehydratase [Proteobacteria bacterium]|nr:GDP-mannose 4,6-dehydratase [Pseudomonadota bacterium]